MRAKLYHIERLPAKNEKEIRIALKKGSENIIGTLHKHFISYSPFESEETFIKVLLQIGKTIAEVASLPELSYKSTNYKRIAYLPGYTTKEGKRIAYKVPWNGKQVASDISFEIDGKNKIRKVKESVTNQALLYHHLLEHFNEDSEFLNGGTHQFLVENSSILETKQHYHVDLVQVFNGEKTTSELDEMTFLNIPVDFKKYNSVEKLYNYFDTEFNRNISQKKWPYNVADSTLSDQLRSDTRKMRGYLVALWYKVLHDENKADINDWFKACKEFASTANFSSLKTRLIELQDAINWGSRERYNFWYSLVFNPLPDFTVPSTVVKETLGSSMIMTNFELKPTFYFWIQPWINRMYRHIRDFENIGKAISDASSKLRTIYTGNDRYLPRSVQGGRLYRADTAYKHEEELIYYYQEYFSKVPENEIDGLYAKAIDLVNSVSIIHLIQLRYQDSIPAELKTLIDKHRKAIDVILPPKAFGFNSMLRNHNEPKTKILFKNRLIGRMSFLLFYCNYKYSVEQIHSILTAKVREIGLAHGNTKNSYSVCRVNYFIDGLVSGNSNSAREHSIQQVIEVVSPYERDLIDKHGSQFLRFLGTQVNLAEYPLDSMLSELYK